MDRREEDALKTNIEPRQETSQNDRFSEASNDGEGTDMGTGVNIGMGRSMVWHTMPGSEVAAGESVRPELGLTSQEAAERLAKFGPNRLSEEKHEPLWEVFLEEVREPLILLLIGVGILYGLLGQLSDAAIIFGVILFVVSSEVWNEGRAGRAIAALHKLAEPITAVRRDGSYREVPSEEVVAGDIILLDAGRWVSADARLLESYGVTADESALTGEAVPGEKEAGVTLPEATPLAERRNMIFSGTTVTRGRGSAIVVATGSRSEIGRVAEMAREVKAPRTPLQVTMRELSRWMVWLAIALSVLVPLLGWLIGGQPIGEMILTGLSLAFATIPEELPILITVVLALGAYRLSRERAIVKKLRAVETLGSVNVIATDKTGTLTENRMRVSRIGPEGHAYRRAVLEIGALCNDAMETADNEFAGDPMEVALLEAASKGGLDVQALRARHPLLEEYSFDNERNLMAVVYAAHGIYATQPQDPSVAANALDLSNNATEATRDHEGRRATTSEPLQSAVKGAPEAVLSRCNWLWTPDGEERLTERERQRWLDTAASMSAEGLRVIAFARKSLGPANGTNGMTAGGAPASRTEPSQEDAENDLAFVGLVGLEDPPRPEAKEAIATCRAAGIRPIMVTGDHPLTARAIAEQVGLALGQDIGADMCLDRSGKVLVGPELDVMSDEQLREAVNRVSIYARTTPEHKLRIVKVLQEQGDRVAVTGDGINDGPALAQADIGVAMGETGTDVAREAADIVLADDNFATIVRAVREGRILFANLRKSVRYYLSCKVALVSATLLPVLLGVPVPLAPIQIILTELFMDLAASGTFVAEPPESDLIRQPPRDTRVPFMNRAMVTSIFTSAAGLFAAVALSYLVTYYSGASLEEARTVAFTTWLLGHVLLALNMRSEREPLLRIGFFSNRLMIVWALATAVFVLLVTFVPWVQQALHTTHLSRQEWGLVIASSVLGTFWIEARKLLSYQSYRRSGDVPSGPSREGVATGQTPNT
jgi:Ca2+-transporting ATPase